MLEDDALTTSSRKLDHIRICLGEDVRSDIRPFDDLMLVHRGLPEIDASDIDTKCSFLGRDLRAPLMISAMTGGHPDTREINSNLATAAEEIGVAIGVGSQRAALEDPSLEDTFSVVRDRAPGVPVIGNIGAVQLKRSGPEILDRLAEMIDADALAVHLNFLQESIQPEGETDGRGALAVIRSATDFKVPIIVKETGAGISFEDAVALKRSGVEMVDVAGVGGTSWSGVEAFRAKAREDLQSQQMGELFWSWGTPTPVSVVECLSADLEVISSGGVLSGLEAAKSLALGASIAGTALPMLAPATVSSDEVVKVLLTYVRGLRTSMFLTGCVDITALRGSPVLILGRVREILEQRGFQTKKFSVHRELSR